MGAELNKKGRQATGWVVTLTGCVFVLGGTLFAIIGIVGAAGAMVYGNWVGHSGVWFHLIPTAVVALPLLYFGSVLYRRGLRMTNGDQAGQDSERSNNAT